MAARISEKRPLGALGRMSLVAGAHAALLLGIAGGLGIVPALKIPEPLLTRIIDQPVLPPPDDPVVRAPNIPTITPTLPTPEVLPLPDDLPTDTIGATFVPMGELPLDKGSAVVVPTILGPHPDPRRPLSQPTYPAEMIRVGAQGSVEVEVFVQPDGRVGDARIVRTSGYDAFDRNTLDEAKRKWRLVPAKRDGVAIPQWYRMRVVFKLKEQ